MEFMKKKLKVITKEGEPRVVRVSDDLRCLESTQSMEGLSGYANFVPQQLVSQLNQLVGMLFDLKDKTNTRLELGDRGVPPFREDVRFRITLEVDPVDEDEAPVEEKPKGKGKGKDVPVEEKADAWAE